MEFEKPAVIAKKWHSPFMRWRMRRRVHRIEADGSRYEAAERRFREGLRGELPKRAERGVILAACNDYYYWNFAITMLRSIERHGEREDVHLHLCGPRPETEAHVRALAAELRNVRLSWTADDGTLAATLRYPTIHFAAVRFLLAPLVMDAAEAPVLCVDIDGIAMRPIWTDYEPFRNADDVLLIKRNSPKDAGRRILASALGINQTANGRRFASALSRSIAAALAMRPVYHVDQILIHYLTDRMERKHRLKAGTMPKSFADFDFGADSTIWTAKGWQRKNSEAYADAMKAVEQEQAAYAAQASDEGAPR